MKSRMKTNCKTLFNRKSFKLDFVTNKKVPKNFIKSIFDGLALRNLAIGMVAPSHISLVFSELWLIVTGFPLE